MVSTKFYSGYDEDVYITEWAEYGNMSVDRLKALEIEFLDAMDWKIYVSNETFFKKLKEIERHLAERETRTRGWLTYTELCTLMPSIDAIRKAVSYSALLAVSYTAGVIALAGAFFVASQVPGSYLCDRTTTTTNRPSTVTTGTGTESVSPTSVLNESTTDGITGSGGTECRPGGQCFPGISGNLTELEQRLILNGVDWDPISTADEDGKRIHLNRGTDYWTTNTAPLGMENDLQDRSSSESNDTDKGYGGFYETHMDELSRIGLEGLAHGTIRKRENDTTLLGLEEWSPFQNNHHDLSFLSYLWLKFL